MRAELMCGTAIGSTNGTNRLTVFDLPIIEDGAIEGLLPGIQARLRANAPGGPEIVLWDTKLQRSISVPLLNYRKHIAQAVAMLRPQIVLA